MRFATHIDARGFGKQHWPSAVVCLLVAASWSPLAAQPVVDLSGQRSSVAEKRSRPTATAGREAQTVGRSAVLPETRELLDGVRFVAPWRGESGSDPMRRDAAEAGGITNHLSHAVAGSDSAGNLSTLGSGLTVWDLGPWGRFALDLTGVLQPLLVRDAVGAAASTARLSYRAPAEPADSQGMLRLPAFPPWPLALLPLAATPLVGALAIRVRRAIEPHLQARLAKRRRRRPGRRWQAELEGLGLARWRRKHHHRRRHSRRKHRRIRFESGQEADEGSR
jgi:hypothetical protein